jgi:hypothetical protein
MQKNSLKMFLPLYTKSSLGKNHVVGCKCFVLTKFTKNHKASVDERGYVHY